MLPEVCSVDAAEGVMDGDGHPERQLHGGVEVCRDGLLLDFKLSHQLQLVLFVVPEINNSVSTNTP